MDSQREDKNKKEQKPRRKVRFRRPRLERMVSEKEIDIGGKLFPMAGVSFLVLLILISTARDLMSKTKVKVDIPQAKRIEAEPEEHIAITVTKDRKFYVNDREVAYDTLYKVVDRLQRQDPDTEFWYKKLVLIRGDKSLPFGVIIKALDAVKKAKSERVAFAVLKEKEHM